MKPIAAMALTGFTVWLGAVVMGDRRDQLEALLGVCGPLLVAGASWVLMERTYRRRPDALTALMVVAFGCKLVFFGAYVAVLLRVLPFRPVPFVESFVVSFIALHLVEALFLRRLVQGGMCASSSSSNNR